MLHPRLRLVFHLARLVLRDRSLEFVHLASLRRLLGIVHRQRGRDVLGHDPQRRRVPGFKRGPPRDDLPDEIDVEDAASLTDRALALGTRIDSLGDHVPRRVRPLHDLFVARAQEGHLPGQPEAALLDARDDLAGHRRREPGPFLCGDDRGIDRGDRRICHQRLPIGIAVRFGITAAAK